MDAVAAGTDDIAATLEIGGYVAFGTGQEEISAALFVGSRLLF